MSRRWNGTEESLFLSAHAAGGVEAETAVEGTGSHRTFVYNERAGIPWFMVRPWC